MNRTVVAALAYMRETNRSFRAFAITISQTVAAINDRPMLVALPFVVGHEDG